MSADPTPADVARMRHVVEEAEAYIAAVKEGDMVGCAALEAAVDRYVAAGRAAATPDGGEWETQGGWAQKDGRFIEAAAGGLIRATTHQRQVWYGPVEPVPADETETGR